MKRLTFSLFGAIMLAMPYNVWAQEETIILKDGTEYIGYISKQELSANSTSVVEYVQATINIPIDSLKDNEITVRIEKDSLSPEWMKWADDNKCFEKEADEKLYLTLSEIKLSGQRVIKVFVSERGKKFLRGHIIENGSFTCNSSDIYCILSQKNNTLLTKLDDVITTKENTITGEIIEQYPGRQLKVKDEKGDVYIIDYADIISVDKQVHNSSCSIWEQSPWLEQITLKDGNTTGYGIIQKKEMQNDGTVTILTKDNKDNISNSYRLRDISSIKKTANSQYKPTFDIILKKDEAMVNREPISWTDFEKTKGKLFFIAKDSVTTNIKCKSKHITIETNIDSVANIYVVAAIRKEAKNNTKENSIFEVLCYSFENIVYSTIQVEKSVSINNTTKIEFDIPKSDYYIIFFKEPDKHLVFYADISDVNTK